MIGYLTLDLGYEVAEKFVLEHVYPEITTISKAPIKSYKTMAQEHIQKIYKQLPDYVDTEEQIDDKGNVLLFRSEILVEKKVLAI